MRSTLFAVLLASASIALAPAPASAQPSGCGGYYGEGCWTPQQRDQLARRLGLPQWRGGQQRHHRGQRGHGHSYGHSSRGAVLEVYTWTRRTCRDWVMQGGVKIYIGPPRSC